MLAQADVENNGISVAMALGEGLPLIEGDRVQLQQVILNLINNAAQTMSCRRRIARIVDPHQQDLSRRHRRFSE
jgi:C4-dicarboxylate-specific signal transduction histidine kinase